MAAQGSVVKCELDLDRRRLVLSVALASTGSGAHPLISEYTCVRQDAGFQGERRAPAGHG